LSQKKVVVIKPTIKQTLFTIFFPFLFFKSKTDIYNMLALLGIKDKLLILKLLCSHATYRINSDGIKYYQKRGSIYEFKKLITQNNGYTCKDLVWYSWLRLLKDLWWLKYQYPYTAIAYLEDSFVVGSHEIIRAKTTDSTKFLLDENSEIEDHCISKETVRNKCQ
jgi:hypothetical protein